MGVFSNPANKPAKPVTAWFCKVGHHLGTIKQKISKPLCGLLTDLVYRICPEKAILEKLLTIYDRRGLNKPCQRNVRPFKPLIEWAFADAEPREPA